jgi:large subunit ribosomal protein LP0
MPPKADKGKGGDAKKGGDDKKAGKGDDKKAAKGDDKKKGGDDKKKAGDDKKAGGDEKAAEGGDAKAGEEKKEKVAAKPKKIKEEKPKSSRRQRKEKYRAKLKEILVGYRNALIVGVDNVGSNQLQKIRLQTRKDSCVLMGKNTIIRKVIREMAPQNPKLEAMLPYIVGNMGFVFTNAEDLNKLRQLVTANKVPAVAKTGVLAPDDVYVPPGPTGLDPAQTSFFQALNIATKIARGSIEIVNQVHLIKKGEKISASAVALLTKLDIKPFFYGVKVNHVFQDGMVYAASVLDMTQEDLFSKFISSVRTLAALSIGASYPTTASLPAYLQEGFRKLVAVSFETEYSFNEAKAFKAAAANAPVVSAKETKGEDKSKASKKVEEEEKPKEESDNEDMGLGGGLFGDDD